MTYIIEVLRQEHRNIESLLRVLERELSVFDRGERPDYEVVLAVIDYFKRRVSSRAQRAAARGLGRYCSETRRPLRPILPAGVCSTSFGEAF